MWLTVSCPGTVSKGTVRFTKYPVKSYLMNLMRARSLQHYKRKSDMIVLLKCDINLSPNMCNILILVYSSLLRFATPKLPNHQPLLSGRADPILIVRACVPPQFKALSYF